MLSNSHPPPCLVKKKNNFSNFLLKASLIFSLGTYRRNPSSRLFVVESGILQSCYLICTLIQCKFVWTWDPSHHWSVIYLITCCTGDLLVERLKFKLFGLLGVGQAFIQYKYATFSHVFVYYFKLITQPSRKLSLTWLDLGLSLAKNHSNRL